MHYKIEERRDQDLIITRHYRYNSADDVRAYLEAFVASCKAYPYKRLLADYSKLEEVNLSFIDKIRVLGQYSHFTVKKVARTMKQAVVTSNDFQKAIAQQARSLSSAEAGDNITGTAHYFESEEEALDWLLDEDQL